MTGSSTVRLAVPAGLDSDVVPDPFFVPLAILLTRVAVQRAAPVVIRAAAQGSKQILSKGVSAASRPTQAIVKNVRYGTPRVGAQASQLSVAAFP